MGSRLVHLLFAPIPDARCRGILRVLWVTLWLNWLIAGIKTAIGLVSGNLTVIGDGLHSFIDGANNVLGIVSIRLAARPADEDHPYGHQKYEHVASLVIGALVVLMAYEISTHAVVDAVRYLKGTSTHARGDSMPGWYMVVVGATMLVNLGISRYERRAGDRLQSPLLHADAAHTSSDVVVTAMGLASLALSHLVWWVDPLLAVVVAVFLLRAAWSILRENLATMTDHIRLDPVEIRRIAESIDGVSDAHAIRTHGMQNDVHLDLHIVVPADMTAGEVSRIEDLVRDALQARFSQVTLVNVHHEIARREEPDAEVWKAT